MLDVPKLPVLVYYDPRRLGESVKLLEMGTSPLLSLREVWQ